MGVSKSTFRVTGETRAHAIMGSSQLKTARHFCPTCGSLLFGTPEVIPDMVSIYVGSLDDPSVFQPECSLFTCNRYHWDTSGSQLPGYETMSD